MAGYDYYTGAPDDEKAKVAYYMNLFGQIRSRRVNFEAMWEESASLVWPEYRNSFSFGHNRPPGMKFTEFQVDSSGSIAAHRFMSICDALLTPYNVPWSVIKSSDKDLMKDRSVRAYFQEVTKTLWTERYRASANFMASQQQNYQCLGVFGGQGMFVDELDTSLGDVEPGLRYIGLGPGEMYLLQSYQGQTTGYIRHFRWTAKQAYDKWPEKIGKNLTAALEQNSQTLYDFLQFVMPRTDYAPEKVFTPQGKRYSSCYISTVDYCILEEGGYRSFPLAYGRYTQAPEEDYGRGPAQQVLAELKTQNAQKSDYLKVGHRQADPAYLIGDDGLVDFKSHPGAFNYGGFNEDGKMVVGTMPTGDFEVSEKMMEASKRIIDDAFLMTLFPLLFDQKGAVRSAREVIEAASDRGIFLAPTLGRQYGEYLGTMVERELDILSYQRKLPKMPPALREAKGQFDTVWTSPLARALSGQAIGGYMRSVEIASEVVKATGDQSAMDIFDFDTALPDIAYEQFAPMEWMSSPKQIEAKRRARAQEQERDRASKELPGKAAIMKAQAISDKAGAGQNIGGTLSGVPEGQMPQMPQ